MHTCFSAQPPIRIVTCEAHRGALDARYFTRALIDHFGAKPARVAPLEIHAQQHLRPVLSFRASRARLYVEKRIVRIHRARKHASEFELAHSLLKARRIGLDALHRLSVIFLDGEIEELAGIAQPRVEAIECSDQRIELRPFAPELLGPFRCVPDAGILELTRYFVESVFLLLVLKDTPVRRSSVLRDP